jgi:hypothetical protein
MVPLPVTVALPGTGTRRVVLKPRTMVLLVKALVWIVRPLEDVGMMSVTNLVSAEVKGTAKEVDGGWSMGVLMTAAGVEVMTGAIAMDMKVAARTLEAEKSVRSARVLMGAILRC